MDLQEKTTSKVRKEEKKLLKLNIKKNFEVRRLREMKFKVGQCRKRVRDKLENVRVGQTKEKSTGFDKQNEFQRLDKEKNEALKLKEKKINT